MVMVPFPEMSSWVFVWGERKSHSEVLLDMVLFLFLLGSVGVFLLGCGRFFCQTKFVAKVAFCIVLCFWQILKLDTRKQHVRFLDYSQPMLSHISTAFTPSDWQDILRRS
jgi:hypothetical protein